MIEQLLALDQKLFTYLNDLNSPYLDPVFWFITAHFTWIPFYLFLVFLIIKNFGKGSIVIFVSIALLIPATDKLTSGFMKPFFGRLRPCHSPEISETVHLLYDWCGGSYGFVSSHAANTFALATFIFLLFKNTYPYIWLMFVWSSLVAYSRIYAGVHYPGDVIAGALVGTLLALLIFKLMMVYLTKKQSPALKKI